MAVRVAIVSSDGKVINQHFGAAGQFLIFNIDGEIITYFEKRENNPSCGPGGHSSDKLAKSIDLISDCKLVLVSRIGPAAESALNEKGVESVESGGLIKDALIKLQRSLFFKQRLLKLPIDSKME